MLESIVRLTMMISLGIGSIVGFAVLLDRYLAFRANAKIDTRALRAKILALLAENKIGEAATVCANTPGPVSAVLLAGLEAYQRHKTFTSRPEAISVIMKEAMEEYLTHAMGAVDKRLYLLATIGNVAPLLGMAGTVTGMIKAFSGIAAAGAISPGAVAGGISEALINTAAGIVLAIVMVVPYHIFMNMGEQIHLEIEEAAAEVLEFVSTEMEKPKA